MIALTHLPSPHLDRCELTHIDRKPIDFELAVAQHEAYRGVLQSAGYSVRAYDFNRNYADSVFVEDVAVILDEVIVCGAMGVASRQPELEGWRTRLSEFGKIAELPLGVKLEGGDVLRIGHDLVIGKSTRTNLLAIEAVSAIVKQFGYAVHAVPVVGCLHLKTACTALDDHTLLVNPNWIDTESLPSKRLIVAADDWGANIVRLPDRILANSQYVATIDQLRRLGFPVSSVDLSEFAKAEAGATCLSLLI